MITNVVNLEHKRLLKTYANEVRMYIAFGFNKARAEHIVIEGHTGPSLVKCDLRTLVELLNN